MDESQVKRLKQVVRTVIGKASRPGGSMERGEFTMGIARRNISVTMGLGEQGLDEQPWKGMVKKLVNEAIENSAEQGSSNSSPVKEDPEPASKASKPRSKATSKRNEEPEEEEEEERAGPSRQPASRTKGSRSPVNESRKKLKKQDSNSEVEEVSSRAKKRSEPIEVDDKSESEMSVLYDEDPAKPKKGTKRKSGSKKGGSDDDDSAPSSRKKEKRPKKAADDDLSPEEVKVNELKKIVTACGVRKQWSKEFAELDTPREQRKRLEAILSELGMKGQPTLGKAKSLKEKRELAAELDDVREFESKRGLSSSRSSRIQAKSSKKNRKDDSDEDDSEERDEEETSDEEEPLNKGNSALGAIMDFLGDDGDDSDD